MTNIPSLREHRVDIVVDRLFNEDKIDFLRLQFTDIMGVNKNVEIPRSQFKKALSGEIMFDGSSIEGFVRIEESDMLLVPDLDTLIIIEPRSKVARVICDIHNSDGTPFEGCPRLTLKRVIQKAKEAGFDAYFGCEAEFFLFSNEGEIHDRAGYFDMAPLDLGEEVRRKIVRRLEKLNFEIEASHHEVAQGQHEIDFKYANPLITADNLTTFKFVVRQEAQNHGLMASFMPKPLNGVNGSGMHTHQSLFNKQDGRNAFWDPNSEYELSETALYYIGGLLRYAGRMCAITNPTVNSYKRLVPGFEAPTKITWSLANRSPLIRVPAKRGQSTRCELRMPDPSANPYLALAVQLAAGLKGIEKQLIPGHPATYNLFDEMAATPTNIHISSLPRDLCHAIDWFEDSQWTEEVLGRHIYTKFIEAKRQEWKEYSQFVSSWETDRFLGKI